MALKVIHDPHELQAYTLSLFREGKTVGFVPTMGYLHEGHLSLFRCARRENDVVVASIFVNPTQFGPGEDFERYPRDPQGDKEKAESERVDVLFMPRAEDLYPLDFQTFVEVERLTRGLCGAFRPGHFRGVTTVVTKLLMLAFPTRAYFGRKDFQQWRVIEQMVRDLHFPVEIVSCPIVREPDGLAMSSRNVYLSPEERQSALSLYRSLRKAEALFREGETRPQVYEQAIRTILESAPHLKKIDYIAIVDGLTLEPVDRVERGTLIALAAHVGPARLIDNWWVGVDSLDLPS